MNYNNEMMYDQAWKKRYLPAVFELMRGQIEPVPVTMTGHTYLWVFLAIAYELNEAADRWAKETGAAGIRLDSGIEREPAHVCYQKNGYAVRKPHKNFKKLF